MIGIYLLQIELFVEGFDLLDTGRVATCVVLLNDSESERERVRERERERLIHEQSEPT